MDLELCEHWAKVEQLLTSARAILAECDGSVDQLEDSVFREYLENNELELALDELEALSNDFEVPREFWQLLVKAANSMGLKAHLKRYVKYLGLYG